MHKHDNVLISQMEIPESWIKEEARRPMITVATTGVYAETC